MANMKLIETKTVGAGGVAFVTFSAIPQTYTDLKLYVSSRDNRAGQPNDDISIQVGYNGSINTGSIYTYYRGYGTGSGVGSDNNSGTALNVGFSTGATATASVFGNNSIYIGNYTSSNNKTVSCDGVSENNATTSWTVLNAGQIATSNPITDIKLFGADATLWSEHTTFYLYGISNTIASGAKAYGGYVTEDDNFIYHTFTSSGVFTPIQSLTTDYLVVAGGGGGGAGDAGGGGAGGYRTSIGGSALSLTAQAYAVTVGAGGTAGLWTGAFTQPTNGTDSTFSTITSTGGGRGGSLVDGANFNAGGNGGSGGGGGRPGTGSDPGTGNTPSTSPSQGNNGAAGTGAPNYFGGGGGGSSSAGSSNIGGAGTSNSINGIAVVYATGGTGALIYSASGDNGTINTGNGGPGAGRGGSGIVIVRYAK